LVAETYAAMAFAYRSMNDMPQARRTMQYALEIRERVHKEKTAGYADLLDDSARLYAGAKDPGHFQSDEERAIAIRQGLWRQTDPRFVSSLKRIADENQYGENNAFSEKLYRRIVEIQRDAHTEKSEAYYSALADLANCLRSQKRFGEAQDAFERAFSVREKMGKRDAIAAYCMDQIARVRMSRGMYQEAVQAGEASLQIRAHLENPSERDTAWVDAQLAEACLRAP
jgi:tetratricopeptide (TPR) repeat protein